MEISTQILELKVQVILKAALMMMMKMVTIIIIQLMNPQQTMKTLTLITIHQIRGLLKPNQIMKMFTIH